MSLSISEKLKVELRGHTALVTIDNPAANTWDVESLPALKDLVEKLNADKSVYALVLTGAGDKFFSAGADLKLFADGDPATAGKMATFFGEAFETLADFRGVSIAAVNGFAMGGGLAAERTKFVDLFSTDDQREGVNAFLEKRKPEWNNS